MELRSKRALPVHSELLRRCNSVASTIVKYIFHYHRNSGLREQPVTSQQHQFWRHYISMHIPDNFLRCNGASDWWPLNLRDGWLMFPIVSRGRLQAGTSPLSLTHSCRFLQLRIDDSAILAFCRLSVAWPQSPQFDQHQSLWSGRHCCQGRCTAYLDHSVVAIQTAKFSPGLSLLSPCGTVVWGQRCGCKKEYANKTKFIPGNYIGGKIPSNYRLVLFSTMPIPS